MQMTSPPQQDSAHLRLHLGQRSAKSGVSTTEGTQMMKLHVGRGEHRGPLTTFPICQERSDGPPVVLGTADTLLVAELASPQVGHLEVTALAHTQVLLLDGDVLVGGWQDRVAVGSVLLAARAVRRGDAAGVGAAADPCGCRAGGRRPTRPSHLRLSRHEFVGLVEQMRARPWSTSVAVQAIHASCKSSELRGLAAARRVLHASVINHEAVGA